MKKTISALAIALVFALCATAMTACGNVYDVYLPIGDAKVDNDNVGGLQLYDKRKVKGRL